jgi:sortase A
MSWREICQGSAANDASRKAKGSSKVVRRVLLGFAFVLILLGIIVIAYPLALQQVTTTQQASEVHSFTTAAERLKTSVQNEQLSRARHYNEKLARTPQSIGEVSDPFSGDATGDFSGSDDRDYESQLTKPQGGMASVVIPKISVNLQIFHGSSMEVLGKGAGHLHGTSLPIGGKSTHAVITAHRGMYNKAMFTRLDELSVGDPFYIEVMGKTLGYRVVSITVVTPDDMSGLRIEKNRDLVTLLTCTPYGINDHRLLVTGERAAIPAEVPAVSQAHGDLSRLMWSLILVLFAVPWIVWWMTYRRRRRRMMILGLHQRTELAV